MTNERHDSRDHEHTLMTAAYHVLRSWNHCQQGSVFFRKRDRRTSFDASLAAAMRSALVRHQLEVLRPDSIKGRDVALFLDHRFCELLFPTRMGRRTSALGVRGCLRRGPPAVTD